MNVIRQSLIKNEVWTFEGILSDQEIDHLNSEKNLYPSFDLHPGEEIKSSFRSANVNPTLYRYRIYNPPLRKNRELISRVFNEFSNVTGKSFSSESINPLNFFLKGFDPGGFYALHTESRSMYGEYAFVLFLDDEKQGALVFPSSNEIKEIKVQDPLQYSSWIETCNQLKKNGEAPRIIGPLSLKPKRNLCVLFRVGSAHYVSGYDSDSPGRLCLTGWPFCPDETVETLDRNCSFKNYFLDEK